MESGVEEDRLERGLLLGYNRDFAMGGEDGADGDEEGAIYTASFEEAGENFVNYRTAWWILYSLLLLSVWGVGLLMFCYLPVRRYILRRDIRSRKLYLTRNAIVYKVRRPVFFPCFGFMKKEKHVLLPSVSDVVVEQGFLQSFFGIYSVRIENVGVRRPPSDDFQIQAVTNPLEFREAVLMRLSGIRADVFPPQAFSAEDVTTPRIGVSSVAPMSATRSPGYESFAQLSDSAVLDKLAEVCSSVKKIESLIEEQNIQTPIVKDQGEVPTAKGVEIVASDF